MDLCLSEGRVLCQKDLSMSATWDNEYPVPIGVKTLVQCTLKMSVLKEIWESCREYLSGVIGINLTFFPDFEQLDGSNI